jgi:hypothetical protein
MTIFSMNMMALAKYIKKCKEQNANKISKTMKFLKILRHPFRVKYRLSVLYSGDFEPRHNYGTDRALLRRIARNTQDISEYWSLYKSGPLGLPEREVDFWMKGDRQ